MSTAPSPTKLILALGPQRAANLQPLVAAELQRLGDWTAQIQVIASPFREDALSPAEAGQDGVVAPEPQFLDWVQGLVQRPPADASLVWVLPHLASSVPAVVALARDPGTYFVVVGGESDRIHYLGSSVRYLATTDLDGADGAQTLPTTIAVEMLFRFPTPDREPLVPWAALARVNYQQSMAPAPRAASRASGRDPRRGNRSADGRWLWDGRRWVPNTPRSLPPAPQPMPAISAMPAVPPGLPSQFAQASTPPSPYAQPPAPPVQPGAAPSSLMMVPQPGGAPGSLPANRWEPAGQPPVAAPQKPRRRWFGGSPRNPKQEPPPSLRDLRELIPWRVPLVICVTGIKGGLGKTTTCAGLLLAGQEAAPGGMPILAVDSDPRHPSLGRYLGLTQPGVPLWEIIARYTASRDLIPPAQTRSLIYAYEQSDRIRELDSMFNEHGEPQEGLYDVQAFMERVTREYQIVVVDASSDQDVSSFWLDVADAVVVTTDTSPRTVARTQEYLGLLDYWRRCDPAHAQTPIICAWLTAFKSAPRDVGRRREKIQSGFEMRIGDEMMRTEPIPVVTVPRDQRAHDATDYTGMRRCGVMATYQLLFARIVKSVGPARMRAWAGAR